MLMYHSVFCLATGFGIKPVISSLLLCVQITHDRLITLENRTAMMAKAIIPVLKDFNEQINNTNNRLIAQYRMMTRAHERYNRLFR